MSASVPGQAAHPKRDTASTTPSPKIKEALMPVLERIALWLPAAVMAIIVTTLFAMGWDRLSLGFLTTPPGPGGIGGGIGPILVNTGLIVSAALILALPIALMAALAYAASDRPTGSHTGEAVRQAARRTVELGLCLPRLLWGLAGAAIFGHTFGLGLSAATGILTLAMLLLPILTTGFVDGLVEAGRRVRPMAEALGFDDRRIWLREVLPQATPSLAAAALLASGRAFGDAAALILTAGFGARVIEGLGDSASTLAVHIYFLAMGVGGGLPTAAAAGVVLLALTAAIQLPVVMAMKHRPL
jgi:phosphate transport system permease protein